MKRVGRMEALDSLRGLCALLVALFHYPLEGKISNSAFVENSYLFVDFFFVLSGFVIAYTSEARLQAGQLGTFLQRRALRLYPLHLATLAFFVLAAVVAGQFNADEQHSALAVLSNITLTQGWGFHHSLTWNNPAWSASVEWALYLSFAVLVSVRAPLVTLLALALALAGMAVLFFLAPADAAMTYDFGIFRGISGFFVGVLLTRVPAIRLGIVAEVLVLLLAVTFVTVGELLPLAPLAFAPAVYVLARSDGAISRALNTPPLVALGTWSFGIYMIHAAVIAVLRTLARPLGLHMKGGDLIAANPYVADLSLIPYLAVIIALAAFSYACIERPAMGLAVRKRAVAA
jgi:peptidoglycan/LPS O-acetylase OafA/YrhL